MSRNSKFVTTQRLGLFIGIKRIIMKLAILFSLASASAAFVVQPNNVPASTSLQSSRRDFATNGAAALLGIALAPKVASADVDYSKIQDLLGPGGDYATYSPQPAEGKRPTWLTEPTEEFKENESKAAEFKRKNLLVKQKFAGILDTVTTAPNNETVLAEALDEMRRMVKANKGLPIGITKEEVVKTCRRRKAKKYWPTTVEIA
jgi:hypothetical protein